MSKCPFCREPCRNSHCSYKESVLTEEQKQELLSKVKFLVDHANFYYEQRLEFEPFLKNDYPFKKYSAKIVKEIQEILEGTK